MPPLATPLPEVPGKMKDATARVTFDLLNVWTEI
jgi:hypothetical protein